jgi:hypothetical protein
MAGNRTAITLQSVAGPSFAGLLALPKHISQGHHGSGPCATKGHIKQFVDEVSGEAEVNWPPQSCETANQERQKVIVGDQVKESVHGSFCCDVGTNLHVLSAGFRSALILQSKLAFASSDPDGHDSVVILTIATLSKLVSRTDLRVRHPVHQLLRAFEYQMNLVELDCVENSVGKLSISGTRSRPDEILAETNQF